MEINEVSFSYKQDETFLKDISAKIEWGKVTTIIGPNGSGKSTLLNIISRNLMQASGHVLLDGKEIHEFSSKEFARKLAVVHQQNEAPNDLTVEKLVSYGRIPYKRLFQTNQEEDEEAIEWALSCTRLQDKRSKTLLELSGGERQRVWIAMSLAQKTPILLLDEPTTFLDLYHQIEILELVKSLNNEYGMTIVMVLHDLNQAIRYSDYLFVMKEGKLVMEGLPEIVITHNSVRKIYGVNVHVKEDEESGRYIVPVGI